MTEAILYVLAIVALFIIGSAIGGVMLSVFYKPDKPPKSTEK